MSLFRSERFLLMVGVNELRLTRASGATAAEGQARASWAWQADAWDIGAASLAAALGTCLRRLDARAVVEVSLADVLCRCWTMTPPQNVRSLAELRAAAAAGFEKVFGAGSEDWSISADWRTDRPFIACAVPRLLVATLHSGLGAQRLRSLAPRSLQAWNEACARKVPPGTWLIVPEEGCATLCVARRGELVGARRLRWPCPSEELAGVVEQEALSADIDAPSALLVGDAVTPLAWPPKSAALAAFRWEAEEAPPSRPARPFSSSRFELEGAEE